MSRRMPEWVRRHPGVRVVGLLVLAAAILIAAPHSAAGPTTHNGQPMRVDPRIAWGACPPDGLLSSGAIYRICMPAIMPWNSDVLVFAHGYMAPGPIRIPEEQLHLADGTSIPDAANMLGYAFATTSYSTNGLAVREGIADLVELVSVFRRDHPTVRHIYLVGASEGGLITTLAIEQRPDVFSGGLAVCGPIGDFREQVNHIGDFRVVFDYFFPSLIPGNPITAPTSLVEGFDTFVTGTVLPAILGPGGALSITQVLSVTQAAIDPNDPISSTAQTVRDLLWYNVFGSTDAGDKLGGQPYDNVGRIYTGSLDDTALNAAVQRFHATGDAIQNLQAYYQTSGRPLAPLITLHTTLDQVVPYWHEVLYRSKVAAQGRTLWHRNIAAARYGHCNCTLGEVQQALVAMQFLVENPPSSTFLPIVFGD